MTEIWKDIDSRYSVSNLGNVKSNYANKERILKPIQNKRGYLTVDLRSPGKRKTMLIHRLVAKAFIPNPNNFLEVNHKDEDKTNNCVDNLEWCDTKYNCNYGTRNLRKGLSCMKKVCSVDRNGQICYYDSIMEAAEQNGIHKTSISKALSDNFPQNKTAGGLLWLYDDGNVEEAVNKIGIRARTNRKCVYSVDVDGNVEYYLSIAEAHRATGINNINRAIKNGTLAGNRHWFYDE